MRERGGARANGDGTRVSEEPRRKLAASSFVAASASTQQTATSLGRLAIRASRGSGHGG